MFISFFAFRLDNAVERNGEEEDEGDVRMFAATGGLLNSIKMLIGSL